jgi:Spy/CpxP family protein refolding chaperone
MEPHRHLEEGESTMWRRQTYRLALQAVAAVILLGCAAVAVRAQGSSQVPPTAFQKFVADLKLTPDQQAKIKPILTDTATQMRAAYWDSSLSDRQAAAKIKEIHHASRAKMTPILNAEQNKKLDAALQKVQKAISDHLKAQKAAGH